MARYLAALALIASSVRSLCQGENLQVQTTSGTLQGFSPYPGVEAFFGIPFAKPPVNELRFEPPSPFEPAGTGPIDTTNFRSGCFQNLVLNSASDKAAIGSESEDCLSINIWKPSASNGPLPVVVWLYGGGFLQGANSLQSYDARRFVAEQKDIIFASINYRVNIFGFPNSPAIKTKNVGILDQRLGLEWLRDNIAAFGGDPSRMTLMGHSAGSISAAYLSYAYPEDPIVSSLIELSGQPGLLATDNGTPWQGIARATGCERSDSVAELKCLKSLPARALKRAYSPDNLPSIASGATARGSNPVIDNVTVFSTEEYASRGQEGRFAKLPLLVTHAAHEYDSLLPFEDPVVGVNKTQSDLATLATQQCPVAVVANNSITQGVPTYRYVFDGAFPATKPYDWMRAYHGADSGIIFGNEYAFAWEEPNEAVKNAGRLIRNAIAAFVRDPVDGLEKIGWPKYTGEGNTLIRLFENNTDRVTFEDPRAFDAPCAAMLG